MTNIGLFRTFMRVCAARTGQLLNYADLARDTGISTPTARMWLSLLEISGLIYILYPSRIVRPNRWRKVALMARTLNVRS